MSIQRLETITPDEAMELAIKTAEQGRGFVSPNPLVGCVIVDKDHKFLSAGAHLKFGEAHAEINALDAIGNKMELDGATVYVTLEPCAHHGKTPPCAEKLAQFPIKKVVYAVPDPNPLVSGRGIKILEEKGIETGVFLTYEDRGKKLCEQFLYNQKAKSPFIAMKIASSIDGKIALVSGESQWITGPKAREDGRARRAHYDATMIGAGTFLNDDPILDFRDTVFEGKKDNRIIILDPKGKGAEFYPKSRLAQTHKSKNIYILTNPENISKWEDVSIKAIAWANNNEGWDQALAKLYEFGIYSIYIEGGGYAISQMLKLRRAQKMYIYQASKILGLCKGWSDGFHIKNLDQAINFKDWQSEMMGPDHLVIAWF